jgi:hypothetical protein
MGSARRDWPWPARNMAPESEGNLRLEIGHVLFIDRKKRGHSLLSRLRPLLLSWPRSLLWFRLFTADFLAPFFALLFPLPMSALAAW